MKCSLLFESILCVFVLSPLFWLNDAFSAELQLKVNEGKLYRMPSPVLDVLITNPEIADIQLTQGNGLFVYGKVPGKTHIMALTENDRVMFDQQVRIQRDFGRLKEVLGRQFPHEKIKLATSQGRLIIEGRVPSLLIMEQVVSLVSGYLEKGEKIVNRISLATPMQVNLKVRIMEVNRRATKEMGINWDILLNPGSLAVGLLSGRNPLLAGGQIVANRSLGGDGSSLLLGYSGSDGSINSVIDALAEDDLVTVLAEPNLTSRSGETASFFAGGEFPVPVAADNDRITVEFKKFGVILDMTPTVISPDRISLNIKPEVSELSAAGAVAINNISIPGIAIRRTEATIELASGQSFSVAGMLQNQNRNLVSEVPWLGELDILGPLFRSTKYQRSETELVIIATANIVKPLSRDEYRSPLAGLRTPDNLEKMQKGKLLKERFSGDFEEVRGRRGHKLYGPHGFIF